MSNAHDIDECKEMHCLIDARVKEVKIVYIDMDDTTQTKPYMQVTALLYPRAWRTAMQKDTYCNVPTITFNVPFRLFQDDFQKLMNDVIGYAIPIYDGTNSFEISEILHEAYDTLTQGKQDA